MQSLIDSAGLAKVNNKTKTVSDAVRAGKMKEATQLWSQTEDLIENVTNGVNFYNILEKRHEDNSSNRIAGHLAHQFISKDYGETVFTYLSLT